MLTKLDQALKGSRLVIVPGDTNSALAGALAAVKMGIDVGHVEAGLRSGIRTMPEEINRILVDHMSAALFAPTKAGYDNLVREGIDEKAIFQTGDVMADNVVMLGDKIAKASPKVDIGSARYVFATVHRAENVDDSGNLRKVVEILSEVPGQHGRSVVFPVHPHTRRCLEDFGMWSDLERADDVHLVKPVSYLESLRLTKDADVVLTDSGGVQKEAFLLGTPAVTLRKATEWVETTDAGWNVVAGLDRTKIDQALGGYLRSKPPAIDPLRFYGDGKASQRIAGLVKELLA